MKLYCGISFHGFGHIAQSAPVINSLLQRCKVKQLIIHCDAPKALLCRWFDQDFEHIQQPTDLGTPMVNALKVDVEQTWVQFSEQHRHKAQQVEHTRQLLEKAAPALILSNNSYLLSRAASELGIPCFHLCSLNWADNFLAFCGDKPRAQAIYQALCDDYNCADAFFRLPPYMPMPGFTNLVDVGPVCRVGTQVDLKQHFGHADNKRYIVVSMGGMPYPIHYENWPQDPSLFIINGGAEVATRPNLINVKDSGISMLDLTASVDAIVTKPGYGAYCEAAVWGTPILYLPRGDWPEEPWLNAWEQQHVHCEAISDAQLQSGQLHAALERVITLTRTQPKPKVQPTGVAQIVDHMLGSQGNENNH